MDGYTRHSRTGEVRDLGIWLDSYKNAHVTRSTCFDCWISNLVRKPVMEATAKYDFAASAQDELRFRRGDWLRILDMDEYDHWYTAELRGKSGLIPDNPIETKPHDWYNGRLDRDGAVRPLTLQSYDGAFLVRQSKSTPGDFTLSVRYDDVFQHYKNIRDPHGKFFLWDVKFDSLNELVGYHKSFSVSRSPAPVVILRDMEASQDVVIAEYDFVRMEDYDLEFKRGDPITVRERTPFGWWIGELRGRVGLIPVTYVRQPLPRASQVRDLGGKAVTAPYGCSFVALLD